MSGDEGSPASGSDPLATIRADRAEAMGEIEADFAAADQRGIVYCESDLANMAKAAEDALLPRVDVFQRGGFLVRLTRRPEMTERGVRLAEHSLAIVPVTFDWMRTACTESATWLRVDRRDDSYKRMACPELVVRTLLANEGRWAFPPIRAITECPTLRSDGTVLQQPGYDCATGVYFDAGDQIFPHVPQSPTDEDVSSAREELAELVADFPFCEPYDRSVMLAAILTAIVRPSLPTVPLFGWSAPVRGSGKTAAAQVVASIATGRPAPVIQLAKDAAEEAKVLLSALIEGYPVVLWDNVEHTIKSPALCSVITAATYAGRLLGKTGMVSAPNGATFLATGNNLSIAGDLTSRTLVCCLDPQLENPSTREFERDIYAYAVDRRASLVWAALVLMRAYLSSSAPRAEGLVPWNRFPAWCALVRGTLMWHGYPDPCEALRKLEDDDPDRQQHGAVLSTWWRLFGDEKLLARELVAACASVANGDVDFADALRAVAGERDGSINAKSLGWWLKRHAGRIQGGLCLRLAERYRGQIRWQVVGSKATKPTKAAESD